MEEAGFEDMGAYVMERQNTDAQYIATRTVLDLCEETVRRYGVWFSRIWWEQEGLDLSRTRAAVESEEDGEMESE